MAKEHFLPECPFYAYKQTQSIACEGYADNASLSIVFKSVPATLDYYHFHCCRWYQTCPSFATIASQRYPDVYDAIIGRLTDFPETKYSQAVRLREAIAEDPQHPAPAE